MGFILGAGAVLLLLAAVGLGMLYWTTPYERARTLGTLVYHETGFQRLALPLTPDRYHWLRAWLGAGALLGTGLLAGVRQPRQQLLQLGAELRSAGARLVRRWQRWPAIAKFIVAGLVTGLVAVRAWYLLIYPLGTDEVASYDYFVRQGLVAITGYYPIPNNHIFFNLLAWPLAQAGLSPRLVMRLPTLLLGTLGTLAGYVLLARVVGLRWATLVVGLVGLGPLWVYYAAVGRGYFIQFCLLQVGFFAVVELLRPASGYRRLGWLAFIGSSILGLYTIPTYAYPLTGLLAGLGVGYLAQGRRQRLGEAVLAGVAIAMVTGLLYLPIILVSGWQQLVANRYVATHTAAQFWPTYRAVLYETAAELFGPSLRFSGPAWLAGALLGAAAVRRWLSPGTGRTLGYLAWAMLALPLLLMAGQRVYAPVRSLLYLTFFGYLLASLLFERIPMRRWLRPGLRWSLVLLLVAGTGALRLYHHQSQVQAAASETQQIEQAYQWLKSRQSPTGPPARVWLAAPLHELFFAHYLSQNPQAPMVLYADGSQVPQRPCDYVVLRNDFSAAARLVGTQYHPLYHDRLVTIYVPNY